MKIPKFLKKKRNIWIIVVLVIIVIAVFFVFGKKNNPNSIQVGSVVKQNLQETVLTTGQVVSATDLELSFQGSGIVRKISVIEGDKVSAGQVLARLDQSSAIANLVSAQGSLAQAEASYDKLINGATQNDVQVLQNAVSASKVNLDNTYNSSLATLNNGYTAIFNTYTNTVNLYNSYFTTNDQEGIQVQNNKDNINSKMADAMFVIGQANDKNSIDTAISALIKDLNSTFNSLRIIRDQCEQGIYQNKVSAADKASLDTQKTAVSTALGSINSLQGNISSYKVALQTAEDNLSAKQAKPRQEDIDLAKAQILSAQGQVSSAQAIVNNSIITAPADGTITQVDIKVGEQAVASKEVMILQDIGNLHTEADVSEANVASLQVGQEIDYTFDALGPDQHFLGKILTINPASTVISGVVNYKIKGGLDNIPGIKPGMTANMTILVAKKDNALAVPSTAIINKNNKQYVRVIDDLKNKTYHEVVVQTGLQADGGLVEIISGLTGGQKIIVYMKQ